MRKAEGGAGNVDPADDPEEAYPGVIGEGGGDGEVFLAGGWAGVVEEFADEVDGKEGGCDAKGDHVGQGIKLGTEVGGGASQSCDKAVEHIEDHGQENEEAGDDEVPGEDGVFVGVGAAGGVVKRGKTAEEVAEGKEGGDEGDAATAFARGAGRFQIGIYGVQGCTVETRVGLHGGIILAMAANSPQKEESGLRGGGGVG